MSNERFRSELVSITTAAPGWYVDITELTTDPHTRKTTRSSRTTRPVIAWAVVKLFHHDRDGYDTEVEPVFIDDIGPTHATAYRAFFSEVTPGPGEPKITHAFEPHREH